MSRNKVCASAIVSHELSQKSVFVLLLSYQKRRLGISDTKHKTPLRIVLIGPPGSGKGTQALKIERDFGPVPISTGHLLRTAAMGNSDFALRLREILERGELVPDDIVFAIVKEALTTKDMPLGWQLDGYPRTPNQAQQLDKLLNELHQQLTVAFYLKVDDNILVERTSQRWVHPASGRIYNLTYKPPRVPGRDDITGEPLVQRDDDKPESVLERLRVYRIHTQPLLDYYASKGLLEVIDSPTSDIGYIQIKKILSEKQGLFDKG